MLFALLVKFVLFSAAAAAAAAAASAVKSDYRRTHHYIYSLWQITLYSGFHNRSRTYTYIYFKYTLNN